MVKLHILQENVILDIVLDDFLINAVSVVCRFRSFPFRRLCRFVLVIRQGIAFVPTARNG